MEEVLDYIEKIEDVHRKKDCETLLKMMSEICNEQPKLWNKTMVGFGRYHFKYGSGREGDWFFTGFSNRKQNLTIYIVAGFAEFEGLLAQLGKHTLGSFCLYIKDLEFINLEILNTIIAKSVSNLKQKYSYDG